MSHQTPCVFGLKSSDTGNVREGGIAYILEQEYGIALPKDCVPVDSCRCALQKSKESLFQPLFQDFPHPQVKLWTYSCIQCQQTQSRPWNGLEFSDVLTMLAGMPGRIRPGTVCTDLDGFNCCQDARDSGSDQDSRWMFRFCPIGLSF